MEYPDGRIEWHEVKGYLDQKSRTKLKRMAKYFPGEKIVVVDKEWFRRAVRGGLAGVIPGWENAERSRMRAGAVRTVAVRHAHHAND